MEGANYGMGGNESSLLDTKGKCFACLSNLSEHCKLQNVQKLFSLLNLNYAGAIRKAGEFVQVDRMISKGAADRFKVKLCTSCGESLHEFCNVERALAEVTSTKDKIFQNLLAVDKASTVEAQEIAQLFLSSCKEVVVEEVRLSKIREGFCKVIVQALEDGGKLEKFKMGTPSSDLGWFVEAFVLNLRLELSKQCKGDVKSIQQSLSVRSDPTPQPTNDEETPTGSGSQGPTSTSMQHAHLQTNISATSSSSSMENPRKSGRRVKATGKIDGRPTKSASEAGKGQKKKGRPGIPKERFELTNDEETPTGSGSQGPSSTSLLHLQTNISATSSSSSMEKPRKRGRRVNAIGNIGVRPTKSASEDGKGQNKKGRPGIPKERFELVFKAEEHYNFEGGKYFCKYCPQIVSGTHFRNHARFHFLGKHYIEWKQKNLGSSSPLASPQGGSVLAEEATSSSVSEGKAATEEEVNRDESNQSIKSPSYSPLSIKGNDASSTLTAEEGEEISSESEARILSGQVPAWQCDLCGELFEIQCGLDKHMSEQHMDET